MSRALKRPNDPYQLCNGEMITNYTHSWEQAIEWLRCHPDKQDLVRHCYYDDPLNTAADRFFHSEEWDAVTTLLGPALPGKVLDIGAGRGISSYAFARSGCLVTALEPYPSKLLGSEAVRALAKETGLPIEVVQESGEDMSFDDETFDGVYCRAALHHASDLPRLCMEAARVLKPGGLFLATREHVLSRHGDLDKFLESHPLHFLYGGENAYTLKEYLQALKQAGLRVKRKLGPYDTVVNYAPMSREQRRLKIGEILASRLGNAMGHRIASYRDVEEILARYLSYRSDNPGRHYSFLATKE